MCQSTMTEADFRALQARVKARQPKRCPQCASSDIVPTFMEEAEWECLDCFVWWTPEA